MKKLMMLAAVATAAVAVAGPSLEDGFRAPPNSAKPHTWYHMMNGNITKAGITRDFEELAKSGIGGVQMFDAGCAVPAGPLKFNSPEWFDLFLHAHREAKRLGLEICIPNCSGWSSSGGPWNTPANAMKVVTHTETAVKGPVKFSGRLPRTQKDNGFYEDIAVLAYPKPAPGASIPQLEHQLFFRIDKKGSTAWPHADRQHPFLGGADVPAVESGKCVDKSKLVDLTARMKPDGRLEWEVPDGEWLILRVGHICNGRRNHPASEMGCGLEVDKLSASAMDFHFSQYVERLCKHLGVNAQTDNTYGFNNILVDSYEVSGQNWTQGMDRIFEQRCGYSIRPYLPVFAGRVVGSAAETQGFLEDFRKLVNDLFCENYAGRLTALCHRFGLQCSIEPYGCCPCDDFQYGEAVDIPMGEFWSTPGLGPNGPHQSVFHWSVCIPAHLSHVWGRRYAATESFTGNPTRDGGRWQTTPFLLKSMGDRVYTMGVNRIIYHRYTHQPWPGDDYLPGMTMGRWGMHFDRTQTWWKYVPAWLTYQARCQWLLQEGGYKAEVLAHAGVKVPNSIFRPTMPRGYSYDVCATAALLKSKAVDGRILVPGGVSYEVLSLNNIELMSMEVLHKVEEFLDAGVTVRAMKKPPRQPGLAGIDAKKFSAEIDRVWAKGVITGTIADALAKKGIAPDCTSPDLNAVDGLRFIHRGDAAADWYFLSEDNAATKRVTVSFRQTGRAPELWNPLDGSIAPAPVWREVNGRTEVDLAFPPSGSWFVVFPREGRAMSSVALAKEDPSRPPTPLREGRALSRPPTEHYARVAVEPLKPVPSSTPDWEWRDGQILAWSPAKVKLTRADGATCEKKTSPRAPVAVEGVWQVKFPSGWGAPARADFPQLIDWTKASDNGIRYFSGTAEYVKEVELAAAPAADERVMLDLGTVLDFAEVAVNGVKFPVLWAPPFRLDVTEAVKGNKLVISVKVTNRWMNRLIGDDREFAPDCEWTHPSKRGPKENAIKRIPDWVKEGRKSPTGRHTFTTWQHWSKEDELVPSGLLGPVTIRFGEIVR